MKRWLRRLGSFAALACAQLAAAAPYVDPHLLDMPWGNYSFIRQGWRGYLETVPASQLLEGFGVVWKEPPTGVSADTAAAELARAGFRRARLEIGWGLVNPAENGLESAAAQRLAATLTAFRVHGLRPLILLNANHLKPCPLRTQTLVLARPAPRGSRVLYVTGGVEGLVPLSTTLMSLADGVSPGALVERVVPGAPAALAITKPLAQDLPSGTSLEAATLAYAPLYPVGTPTFERTAAGWLRYVSLVTDFAAHELGSDAFDVELWNETSGFLDIGNYFEPRPDFASAPDVWQPAAPAWELARRTVQALAHSHPQVRTIWGFSNSSFFHVAVTKLPPGIGGQSYHPYGTGRRCYAGLVRGREALLLDGFVPPGCSVQPEGFAQSWQQTESLVRLVAPLPRAQHPPGSPDFRHFMTEHGFLPRDVGITDAAAAQAAKAKFLERAPLFWLNKGIRALYVYDSYEPEDAGWGMLTAQGAASPALAALGRLTAQFRTAQPLARVRPLEVEVTALGPSRGVLPGDPDGLKLRESDALAVLPFQLDANRFAVAVYVMTQDFPRDLTARTYRLRLGGLRGTDATVRYYAPHTGTEEPVTVPVRSPDGLTVELAVTDVPRILTLEEHG
ncbi:MAG: hypothetical protein JSS29_12245 [Proteobacteria bacterium]|nr:hypothetical protein [Pseudomonadota bacterium]